MKKIAAIIIAALIAVTGFRTYGETVETPLTYTPALDEPSDDDDLTDGDNNRRKRMPPARVICDIDLEAGTITGASPLLADISRYEIWNEEGEICLHESDSAAAMTAALRGLGAGSYRVRLVGRGYALTGIVTI